MKKVLVVVGASGSGKTTITNHLFGRFPDAFEWVKSITTRSKRPGDDDSYYCYVEQEDFDKHLRDDSFAWPPYLRPDGDSFGTLLSDLRAPSDNNRIGVLVLTPETARHFKYAKIAGIEPEEIFVLHIHTPEEVRRERLQNRGESDEWIDKRLQNERINGTPWDYWCSNHARPFVDRHFPNNGELDDAIARFARVVKNEVLQ